MKNLILTLIFIFTANQVFAVNCIKNLYETPVEEQQVIEIITPKKRSIFRKTKNKPAKIHNDEINEGVISEPIRNGGFVYFPSK